MAYITKRFVHCRHRVEGSSSSCSYLLTLLTIDTARAIESQCFVIAAAQFGKHNSKRSSYGHSLVVNPWGEVLADAGGVDANSKATPSMITCEIDLQQIKSVKERMPVEVHRRNAKF